MYFFKFVNTDVVPAYEKFTKLIVNYFTNGWKLDNIDNKDKSFNAWISTEIYRNSLYKSTIQAKDYVIIIIKRLLF